MLFMSLMLASLLIAILAIRIKKIILLFVSAILILPLSLYLSATPLFERWGLIFPILYISAAVSLAKKAVWLSMLLTAANAILLGLMIVIIFQ
ncbi:hypothetical protein AC622_08410 [Bacillus sp. FJAT-27916]|uniref:hypothetical protein n=1 Tax=Bacillus sp. FJAT-27916 TaxID=1679169 RepID=UPI00067118AA|nr:hypothetical protein [Bacillus sp. FJAT-27916]KMY44271.1 hypothetical protein AC622_08410 [Bacillus sp. FJAT-27916]